MDSSRIIVNKFVSSEIERSIMNRNKLIPLAAFSKPVFENNLHLQNRIKHYKHSDNQSVTT